MEYFIRIRKYILFRLNKLLQINLIHWIDFQHMEYALQKGNPPGNRWFLCFLVQLVWNTFREFYRSADKSTIDKMEGRHANCLICEKRYHLFVGFFVNDDSVYFVCQSLSLPPRRTKRNVTITDHYHFLSTWPRYYL